MALFSKEIRKKITKKKTELNRYGFIYVLRKFCRDHILNRDVVYILKRDLSLNLETLRKWQDKNITVRFISDNSDLTGFKKYIESHMDNIRYLMSRGIHFVAVFDGDDIVAYLWLCTDHFYDKELDYTYHCQEGEIFQGVYVHETYRGSPVLLEMFRYGWEHFHKLGYKTVVGAVEESNWRSIRPHIRLGFKESGCLFHTTKLFTKRWTRLEEYNNQRIVPQ